MPAPLELTDRRFGSLVALARDGQDRFKAWLWTCRCDCGAIVKVRGATLQAGKTSACSSCATSQANRTHGQSKTPLYRRWQGMKARCTQPNNKHYPNYGGRGIQVCERWLNSFENFAADMGPTFSEDLELDRIDVDGDYEPSNCRWVDRETQQRNRRNNSRITYRGETRTVTEWAELMGMKPNTLVTRIRRGWPTERVLLELANGGGHRERAAGGAVVKGEVLRELRVRIDGRERVVRVRRRIAPTGPRCPEWWHGWCQHPLGHAGPHKWGDR